MTAPLRGYDGASAFNLAAARANDGAVCSVYIVGTPGGMPHADKARVDAIRANGMGALPNWERAADFFRTATLADCKAAGVEALAACRALGFPDDGTIGCAFSFDYQVRALRYPAMKRKFDAVADGLAGHYIPLAYAQSGLIRYLGLRGYPGPHWLMASTWGLSYNPRSRYVGMVQSHDADGTWLDSPVPGTDINTITQPDRLPAWWPDGSPYGGTGVSAQDVIDALKSDEGKAALGEAVADYWGGHTGDATFYGNAHNARTQAAAAAKALAAPDGVLARIAALQAQLGDVAGQLEQALTELAALKAGALTIAPASLAVTGTVNIGGTQ